MSAEELEHATIDVDAFVAFATHVAFVTPASSAAANAAVKFSPSATGVAFGHSAAHGGGDDARNDVPRQNESRGT
jgi:hypothetical protein